MYNSLPAYTCIKNTFSLHQNVPVNKRHKFGCEYNIPRRVDIVLSLTCSILENIRKYLS
jgi:hypothetical protein